VPVEQTIGPIEGAQVHVALRYYPDDSDVARWDEAHWDVATWPGPAPSEEVSCDVKSYQSGVGRDQPLERFRTGTATIVMQDDAGRYSPWKSMGQTPPAYEAIRPGIDVDVWVTIGSEKNALHNSSFEDDFAGWSSDPTCTTWTIDEVERVHGGKSARGVIHDPEFVNGNTSQYGQLIQTPDDNTHVGYNGPWVCSAWIKGPKGRSIGMTCWRYYAVNGVGTGLPG
jgi:hypothetical protein